MVGPATHQKTMADGRLAPAETCLEVTMSTIYVKPERKSDEVLGLVRSAVKEQVARLELGLDQAEKRLAPFETKYGVSSDYFISEMTAEDLEGGDDEYVSWAGEYRLVERLKRKLEQLREIEYGDSDHLQSDQVDR